MFDNEWLLKRLPPVEKIWRRSEPDFYGASYLIAEQIGKSKPPTSFAAWRHGWFFPKAFVHPRFLGYGGKNMLKLVATRRQERLLKELGFPKVIAVGLPYIYADTFEVERKPGSLLVMPAHTLPYTAQKWDQNVYAKEISRLKSHFSTIVACVHSACIEHRYWLKAFEEEGIPWIRGADSYDKNALIRMNTIFKSFEYMTTNVMGSHVAYAAYAGVKVSVCGTYCAPTLDDFRNDPVYRQSPELIRVFIENLKECVVRCQYPDLFCDPMDAPVRKSWGNEMVGFENKKSPEVIASLLGWSFGKQAQGYFREGLRLLTQPSAIKNLMNRRKDAAVEKRS